MSSPLSHANTLKALLTLGFAGIHPGLMLVFRVELVAWASDGGGFVGRTGSALKGDGASASSRPVDSGDPQ